MTAGQETPEAALAIIEQHRVCAANTAAMALGVRVDMSGSTALSLSGTIKLRAREATHEAATLDALADWACNFSSQVSVSPPDRLLLEIGASLRLFGGLTALLQAAECELRARGHRTRNGLGPTPLAAELLAHALPCSASAPSPWATDGDPAAFRSVISELPIHFLGAPGKQQLAMQRMGFSRLGELLALPKSALGKRFGKDLTGYIDRLCGERPDPRPLHRPREHFVLRIHFLEPLADTSMLLFPMQRLLGEMGRFLDRRQLYCQRLEWRLGTTRNQSQVLPLACSLQQNRIDALLGLSRLALERVRLTDAVDSLELACVESAAVLAQEGQLFDTEQAIDPEAERLLLDRLRLRLGSERVYGLHIQDSHLPEQAWSTVHEPSPQALRSASLQRPCWLLQEPIPLKEHDGRPIWDGAIELISGPERIDTAWWSEPQLRDYFIGQQANGSLLWVFRERASGCWFAQGVFG